MIQNGGFEADWGDEESHRCLVFPTGKAPYETQIGNIFTPPGWVTWFRHDPGTWDQPEVRDAWVANDPVRVRGGQKAMLLFTFYRKHDAGFLQQVAVEPGTRLTLTAWAHAWSNHLSKDQGGHPDDGRWSDGAGYDVVAWKAGTQPCTGDPQQDARSNFTFQVGLDPTGGMDPFASTVVWGEGWHVYNGYCHPLTVAATAQGSKATIFLRSSTAWAFKHNDAYWDDVSLEAIGDGPEIPEPGRGDPRVQYERTYVLLPPDATLEETVKAVTEHFPRRRTVGFSADDAGIGDLDARRVIAVRPEAWSGDLGAFFARYYPGIEFVPVETRPSVLTLTYPTTHLPAVITGRFGDQRPGYVHQGLDLRSSWKQWGDEIVCAFPGEVIRAGYDSKEPSFGVQVKTLTTMANGDLILVRYAHLRDEAGAVYVSEGDQVVAGQKLGRPGSTGVSTADHLHFDVRVNGKYVDPEPLIAWPETTDPELPPVPVARATRGHVGLHLQTMVGGWEDFVREVRPPVVKVLASMHDVIGVKKACLDTAVVWRHVDNNYGGMLDAEDALVGARRWVDKFRDSLGEICARMERGIPGITAPYFYVESINETYSNDLDVVRQAMRFDLAFIDALAETGLPVAPVVMTAAVGNPNESQFELLIPLAAKCERAGGLMGYHCFSDDTEILTENGWQLISTLVAQHDGTRVATLNPTTDHVEYQEPEQYQSYEYTGAMVHLFGKADVLVTPNHRMWIRKSLFRADGSRMSGHTFEFVEAAVLPNEFEIRRDLGSYDGHEIREFTLPEYTQKINQSQVTKTRPLINIPMDDWLRFFGFWVTEGSMLSDHNGACLFQNPGPTCEAISEAAAALGLPVSRYTYRKCTQFAIHNVQLGAYLRQFGTAEEKYVPRELLSLSQRQLRILFDAMMLGDGHFKNGKPVYFCTASPQLADDFQELALKVGYAALLSKHCDGYYYVILSGTRLTPRTSQQYVERIPYSGQIYCVTVPNGLVFVRRNGKASWQGNSYWWASQQVSGLESWWKWHAGRWAEMDRVFVSSGVHVRWYGGESGAVGSPDGYHLLPNDGWQSKECYGGTWVRYHADIMYADEWIREWNAANGDRYLGFVLFTSGDGVGWDNFQVREPQMQSLRDAILARYG